MAAGRAAATAPRGREQAGGGRQGIGCLETLQEGLPFNRSAGCGWGHGLLHPRNACSWAVVAAGGGQQSLHSNVTGRRPLQCCPRLEQQQHPLMASWFVAGVGAGGLCYALWQPHSPTRLRHTNPECRLLEHTTPGSFFEPSQTASMLASRPLASNPFPHPRMMKAPDNNTYQPGRGWGVLRPTLQPGAWDCWPRWRTAPPPLFMPHARVTGWAPQVAQHGNSNTAYANHKQEGSRHRQRAKQAQATPSTALLETGGKCSG
jgi:hypothetical protein